MDTNLQPVEGAGLLSTIFEKLFKGLGKALDAAAEYEEEMGVLKQVNHIPLTDKSTGRDYYLTIKLAPVRGKDNFYYVEAETQAPGFDVSSIDKKTMELDNSSIRDFKKMIIKLIDDNNFETSVDLTSDEVAAAPESEAEGEAQEVEISEDDQAKIESNVAELDKTVKRSPIEAELGNELVLIETEMSEDKVAHTCELKFSVYNIGGEQLDIPEKSDSFSVLDEETGEVLSFESFYNKMWEAAERYAEENGLVLKPKKIFSSSNIIETTLVKDSKGVALVAIKANCDVAAANSILSDIVGSEDFVNELTEEPQSYVITELEDDYDIEPVDSIDTSSIYLDIFKDACLLSSTIQTYAWALGSWAIDRDGFLSSVRWLFSNFTDICAIWVINHTDKYPAVIGAFGNDCTDLSDVCEGGELSIDLIRNQVADLLIGFTEILDLYYVNLEHEEQKAVDDFLNEANRELAYK